MKWILLLGVTIAASITGYLLSGAVAMFSAAALVGGSVAFLQFAGERSRKLATELSLENVSLASRPRLVPLFKMRSEILGLLETHKENGIVAALTFDIQTDMEATIRQALEVCEAQQTLKQLKSGRVRANNRSAFLTKQLETETNPELRASLGGALEARASEVSVYEQLEESKKRMEGTLIDAESAFSTLQSRIALAVADSVTDGEITAEPISEVTDRLKRIASTMQETVQMIRGGTP